MFLSRKTYSKTIGGAISLPHAGVISIPNPFLLPGSTTLTPVYFGNKKYELSDWLGNVRVVINDRKTPVNTGNVTVSYMPQVLSVSDYYSFGSEIKERSYATNTSYRFGFNNVEKINELYGEGNYIKIIQKHKQVTTSNSSSTNHDYKKSKVNSMDTMIDKKIYLFVLFIFSIYLLNSQNNTMKSLYGKWNVINWIVFPLNTTSLNNDDKKDFEKQRKECLKSSFIIDSLSIKNTCNACEFSSCLKAFDRTSKINTLPVIEDNENTMRYPGNEIEENNVVGKTLVRLLDDKYNANTIDIIKTNCKTPFDTYIQIIIINKNKIALFSDEDIIILTRKK